MRDDERAENGADIREYVAHEVAVDRWKERDEPLAVQRRVHREIDAHHGDSEHVDRAAHQSERSRYHVAERAGDAVVDGPEDSVVAGTHDVSQTRIAHHPALEACLPPGDVVGKHGEELLRLLDHRRDQDPEQPAQRGDGDDQRGDVREWTGDV